MTDLWTVSRYVPWVHIRELHFGLGELTTHLGRWAISVLWWILLASIILKYKGKKSLSPQLICLQKARSRSAQGSTLWFSLKLKAGSTKDIKNCIRKPKNRQPLFHNVSGTRAALSAESAPVPHCWRCWRAVANPVNTPGPDKPRAHRYELG